jgi:hypothetical protein
VSAARIDLGSLASLAVHDVRIAWINDWYDGPIEAVAEYQGERCLMIVHDPSVIGTDQPWCWVLYRLAPEARAQEERWHRLFVEHVGAHWDCTGEPHPEPSGQPERFYVPYHERAPRELALLEPIGWIAAMPEPKAPGGPLKCRKGVDH